MPTIRFKGQTAKTPDTFDTFVTFVGTYKPGDMPPDGYIDWHEWAKVQHKAGLRQTRCCKCSRWKFPQELSVVELAGTNQAVCIKCVAERIPNV